MRIRNDIAYPKNYEFLVSCSEKNIGTPRRPTKYEVSLLEVGDSFLYEGTHKVAGGHINFWNLKTGFTFIQRLTEEGLRVWRIS